jgi:hypothetical protein
MPEEQVPLRLVCAGQELRLAGLGQRAQSPEAAVELVHDTALAGKVGLGLLPTVEVVGEALVGLAVKPRQPPTAPQVEAAEVCTQEGKVGLPPIPTTAAVVVVEVMAPANKAMVDPPYIPQ